MQNSQRISRIIVKPKQEDFVLVRSLSDKTEKGPYQVIQPLGITQADTKGAYEIDHHLNIVVKVLENRPQTKKEKERGYQQGYQKDVSVSKIVMRQPSANVVQIYQVKEIINEETNKPKKAFIIMEKGKKTLVDCINDTIQNKLKYIGDVAKGLDHLHKCGIVHRDMKAENVLITSGKVAKIFDFGASKYYGNIKQGQGFIYKLNQQEKNIKNIDITQSKIGTVEYNPPEIFITDKILLHNFGSCDMWQFGLLIVRLVWSAEQGKAAAKNYRNDCEETVQQWKNNPNSDHRIQFPPLEQLSKRFPQDQQLYSLAEKCFFYHPDRRITSSQFVKEYFEKVMQQPTKIQKKIQILSELRIEKVQQYELPKTMTKENMNKEILKNFLDKCTKELGNVKEQDVKDVMKNLLMFAKTNLGYNEEKAKRLIKATYGMIK